MCKVNKCIKDFLCIFIMYMVFFLLENNLFNSFGVVYRKKINVFFLGLFCFVIMKL